MKWRRRRRRKRKRNRPNSWYRETHGCSQRVWRGANKLLRNPNGIRQIGDLYRIQGITGEHTVWYQPGHETYPWICDCEGWDDAHNHVCTHVQVLRKLDRLREQQT